MESLAILAELQYINITVDLRQPPHKRPPVRIGCSEVRQLVCGKMEETSNGRSR